MSERHIIFWAPAPTFYKTNYSKRFIWIYSIPDETCLTDIFYIGIQMNGHIIEIDEIIAVFLEMVH